MQSRRDRRAARREPGVLPSLTRRRRRSGKEGPRSCVRRGDRRPLRHRVVACTAAGAARRSSVRCGHRGNVVMKSTVNEIRAVEAAHTLCDVAHRREDFPILKQTIHGRPLVYLDNAATSQKPQCVIDAESRYHATLNANVHRGIHDLSQRATDAFEAARDKVRRFINAADAKEVVFTRGTTEAINLVAQSYGRSRFKPGDEILVTEMEHHSNIVPWQLLCEQTGAVLRVAPIDDTGALRMDAFEALVNPRTRLVAVAHVSNALGTINPVRRLVELAHAAGAPVLIDGAQAAPHIEVDVRALDCDFYAFSGHKLYGPTGIGVLYGKAALFDAMP